MFFKKKDVSMMTPEELEAKRKSGLRLFALLVVFDIFLVIYLIFEMVQAFTAH